MGASKGLQGKCLGLDIRRSAMALKLALVAIVLVTVAVRNNDRLAASTLKGAEPCPPACALFP